MLAKIYRLSKQSDFKQVFSKGNKIFSKYFIVRILPSLEENSRFSVIVSNKISKKATVRNSLKRKIREIIRLNLDNFKGSFDIIITALSSGTALKYSELEAELLSLFKKAKIQ